MMCRVKSKEERRMSKEGNGIFNHPADSWHCQKYILLFSQYSFSDCYFIDITMVSCACTVGIFMGVSRRFVSVLRANMKAKPCQLEHRTSDEIRMLFVPSGVRTAHAGKGKKLFPLCSLLFALYCARHLHTICIRANMLSHSELQFLCRCALYFYKTMYMYVNSIVRYEM